ncbi:TM2 domain-containing protein 2 [Fusarium oxysporum f. sp. rapae]|uniref:TM2 domain-containing protein 2 n=1 Tax=Fusarium oxysporum f. sp. rapae TaxID=485398 RepID=A0A8J5NGM6_FUSOX|nr:TM2 domain-containing protein 2 [Fusarium oxysporum f. sp. rapae]KAG7408392.1 TM2 domain-containing protein 2 [Fusarium oxysporum f. sp. rapae]
MSAGLANADKLGRALTNSLCFVIRRWKMIMLSYVFIASIGSILLFMRNEHEASYLAARSWGGFDERPKTEKCYRQERTAMILSLLFGVLGVDQFYAHHWPLAVFKLLTLGGLGLWAFVDMILWIVGGVYGTPGCPGGSYKEWQY